MPADGENPDRPSSAPPHGADGVRRVLRGVIDPELGAGIVELGMVGEIIVSTEDHAVVEILLTTSRCPLRTKLRTDVELAARTVPGIRSVEVRFTPMNQEQRSATMAVARKRAQDNSAAVAIPLSTQVLAISSGKGGVGKSTVTVNLAIALARRGLTVGLLDADIWGFSVPRLLGVSGEIEARRGRMIPLEMHPGDGTLKVLSMGFLAHEDSAVMWRGLMLNRAVQQFLEDAQWGFLDYLLVDMPPGTGDVQMGLARMLPRAEVLVVTTPPVAAQKVARRVADMARKGYLRVAGVIENMSAFVCEHGVEYALFGAGGGERLAGELGVPLVASIPLHPSVSPSQDAGSPVAAIDGHPLAPVFDALAGRIVSEIAPKVALDSCTAHMVEAIEAAVAAGEI